MVRLWFWAVVGLVTGSSKQGEGGGGVRVVELTGKYE